MAELIWAPAAIKDIENIASYISKDSVQAAHLQVVRFFERVEVLHNYPLIGSIVPELGDRHYRQLLVNRYRIIYKVISETELHVLTVHHQSRLLENNPVFKRRLRKK